MSDLSDRIDTVLADSRTPVGKARNALFSVGSQDMPVGSDEVLDAMEAFEQAVRADESRRLGKDRPIGTGAWAALVNFLGTDEWLGVCSAALVEVQAETSRRNARRIRVELPERVEKLTGNWAEIRTVSTAQHAADLIDPDIA